jgi:hypothetical protein
VIEIKNPVDTSYCLAGRCKFSPTAILFSDTEKFPFIKNVCMLGFFLEFFFYLLFLLFYFEQDIGIKNLVIKNLGVFVNLTSLSAFGAVLEDDSLEGLSGLRSLHLSSCHFSKSFRSESFRFVATNITELSIGSSTIDDDGKRPVDLRMLTNLVELRYDNWQSMIGPDIQPLSFANIGSKLKRLTLCHSFKTLELAAIFGHIAEHTGLHTLTLLNVGYEQFLEAYTINPLHRAKHLYVYNKGSRYHDDGLIVIISGGTVTGVRFTPAQLFSQIKTLTVNWATFAPNAFQGLLGLESIALEEYCSGELNNDSFKDLHNLKSLRVTPNSACLTLKINLDKCSIDVDNDKVFDFSKTD